MHRTFENLADNPFIGRDASRLVPDARILTFEAHAIFYKILDTEIYIFRILGQKPDFERHLQFSNIAKTPMKWKYGKTVPKQFNE